jgi:trans-aconitate methyltransferase
MRDWNAATYHRVSDPQLGWGLPVLDRLPLQGHELVLDVGCGTGRLTDKLIARLPAGRVAAVDRSASMIAAAREYLLPRHAHRVTLTRADAAALPFVGVADAVFSTATFHWVRDHDRLFASIFMALRPDGRLVAQAGGGPNLRCIHERCAIMMTDPVFAPHFARWIDPWEFADADTTALRLRNAGFEEIETNVVASPIYRPDAASYREFVEHVICRPHLSHLPTQELRDRFLDELTDAASKDAPAFELDYWRLNLDARKPASSHVTRGE